LTDRYEIQLLDKDRNSVHVELACSPISGDADKYQGAIAVVRDITKIIELRKKFQTYFVQKDTASKDVVPICANCKSIRAENDDWVRVEEYFKHIAFSHGICPTCCDKLYPEFDFSDLDTKDTKA
ncbi:MAG: PAS domain-containing protein, partial [Desulfobacula sp.]|nr:PAS domain-containing protein [Desulfobacula sp.]